MTECKIESGPWAGGVGMTVNNETGGVTIVRERQSVYGLHGHEDKAWGCPAAVLSPSERVLSGCGVQIRELIRIVCTFRILWRWRYE